MIKTNNAAVQFNKNMCRLIQFNRESIKDNIYATQVSSIIDIKLMYHIKVESHYLTYIWVEAIKSITTQR